MENAANCNNSVQVSTLMKPWAGDPAKGLPFIVSLNSEKADVATRKLIRSHVMRGKKQRKLARPDRAKKDTRCQRVCPRSQPVQAQLAEIFGMYTSVLPNRVGSDLSFVKLTDGVEPYILLNVIKSA